MKRQTLLEANFSKQLDSMAYKSKQSHCVVSLSKTRYPLLSTGSTKDDQFGHDGKIDG